MGWDPMEPTLPSCGMTPWVGSFDPIKFIYFMLATVLIPYPCYVVVATIFSWEHLPKRPARHYQDILHATSYGLILFIFGNYTQTFNWITILAFWITWPSYSLIAELPFTKTSLPRWKSWPKGMYILFIGAVGIILAFAAYHIYLGYQVNESIAGFLGYYLLGLLIPFTLTMIGFACYKQQNNDQFKLSRFYNQLLFWQWKRAAHVAKAKIEKQRKAEAAAKNQQQGQQNGSSQTPPMATLEDQLNAAADSADAAVAAGASAVTVQVSENPSVAASATGSQDLLVMQPTTPSQQVHVDVNPNVPTVTKQGSASSEPTSRQAETTAGSTNEAGVSGPQDPQIESTPDHPELSVSIQPYVPYAWSASVPAYFHPHHWQMFYALAFFTRFDHWVSRVGGGIVIGCYMQGIMAYGYDYLLEE